MERKKKHNLTTVTSSKFVTCSSSHAGTHISSDVQGLVAVLYTSTIGQRGGEMTERRKKTDRQKK